MNDPTELLLRPMRADDLDAILSIERESISAPHWPPADYRAAIESGENRGLRRLAFVAEVRAAIAGFAIVRLILAPDGVEAELESMVIIPAMRNRGIGAALLAEMFRQSRAGEARWLDLEVRASNTAAVRLYEQAGLIEIGRRPRYYCAPEEDAVLMRIIL